MSTHNEVVEQFIRKNQQILNDGYACEITSDDITSLEAAFLQEGYKVYYACNRLYIAISTIENGGQKWESKAKLK